MSRLVSQSIQSLCLLNLGRVCFLSSSVAPVVHCPVLAPPENGFFVQNVCNNHFDAACGMRCLPDFDLQGTSIRLCQADGTWSGTPASCAGKEEAGAYVYTVRSDLKLKMYQDRNASFVSLLYVNLKLESCFHQHNNVTFSCRC